MERKREEGEGGCPDGREVKREEEGKVATVFFFFRARVLHRTL